MILITGAAGFIGSCMAMRLHREGYGDLVLVDRFDRPDREKNYAQIPYLELVNRADLFDWLPAHTSKIKLIIHLGARTDTSEQSVELFNELNLGYSQKVFAFCTQNQIPLVYASSAATYGGGEFGFHDDHKWVEKLQPLNPYGVSKNEFDKWVLKQAKKPPFWAGFKFFNVFGPNEYHKGRMASVVFHTFKQIRETGGMKLFRSHNPDYPDGGQTRDFIYVKDLMNLLMFFVQGALADPAEFGAKHSKIYNAGTGKARTFLDLATAVFKAMGQEVNLSFIDTPVDIRDNYQYFTEADMENLPEGALESPFHSLETAVFDYVQNYLQKDARY